MTQHFISNVFTEEEIQNASSSNHLLSIVSNGYDPKQNGELILLFKPGFMEIFFNKELPVVHLIPMIRVFLVCFMVGK